MKDLLEMTRMLSQLSSTSSNEGVGESPLSTMQTGIAQTITLLTDIRDQLARLNDNLEKRGN